MIEFDAYNYKGPELEARIDNICSAPVINEQRKELLLAILGLIDLTTLEGSDNDDKVIQLCKKAKSFLYNDQNVYPSAVCIYSPFIKIAREQLSQTPVKIASVGGFFPSGKGPYKLKKEEVRYLVDQGADEVDVVIDRGLLIAGREDQVYEEIRGFKEVCGNIHLKVILETGELDTVRLIRKASEIAILAGADFIKTSTGKFQPAATETATLIMLDTIREYFEKTGKKVGIKPAGGISEPDTAIRYFQLVKETVGQAWLTNSYFRIGASRLWETITSELL